MTNTPAQRRFYATVEYLPVGNEAVVTLTDGEGEWAGAGRVRCRSSRREDLYEAAYKAASLNATSKGGRLETFRGV